MNGLEYSLQLRFNQYDYDFYSCLIRTEVVKIGMNASGNFSLWGSDWVYQINAVSRTDKSGGFEATLELQLVSGSISSCNVAIEFVFDGWHENNYLLMPSAVYNGNRFESRKIAYSPKLMDPRDIGADKPAVISDVPRLNIHSGPSSLMDRSGAMSTPSMGFFNAKSQLGLWILTEQGNQLGDYAYQVTENRLRTQAVMSIQTPVVRPLYQYRITDNQYPSSDQAPDWSSGDQVEIRFQMYQFDCLDVLSFMKYWSQIRFNLIPKPDAVVSIPFSSTFNIQEEKFNRQNWVERHGYYSVGMREMFLQDWQTGWTGGMITTYPLLFEGNEVTKNRVLRNFDFLFNGGISPSGFFFDSGESIDAAFHWYGGDIRKPHTVNWHLIRKSGDALYYILKQFHLMEQMGMEVKDQWRSGVRCVAEAFVKLWRRYGQLGQFVDSQTGEIVVGGSTSGGIVPAALVYCASYFDHPEYLAVAQEIASYFYEQFVVKGIALGGVGDALQNPDSESAYGLLESFAVLYEQTGNTVWLERSEAMAHLFFTWIIGFNYKFPENSTLGKLGVQTFGAVFANTQNKHGAPGICTFSGLALWRLYRATGHLFYLEMLQAIVRFIPQMLSHPNRPIPGLENGWMTERVSTTDWFEGIGELMCGSTWAETSLLLTGIEIPAVYVVSDKQFVFVFDSVDAALEEDSSGILLLRLKNNSAYWVDLKVFVEDSADQKRPLGENVLLDTHRVSLKPGEECLWPVK